MTEKYRGILEKQQFDIQFAEFISHQDTKYFAPHFFHFGSLYIDLTYPVA